MANTQSKTKAAKKAARKKPSKGKRYTQAEKDRVLAYVQNANSPTGRGGIAAAVRKFGITALTISTWSKKQGASPGSASPGTAKKKAPLPNGREAVLTELVNLQKQISKATAEVDALEARFSKLKDAL